MARNRFSFPIAMILLSFATCAVAQQQYKPVHANDAGGGVFEVYDPNDNSTVYVRNVQAHLKAKYPPVQGFGKRLNHKEFAKGTTPVSDVAGAAGAVVNTTANTAYNVANRVPSWRRYTLPLKALLGSPNSSR